MLPHFTFFLGHLLQDEKFLLLCHTELLEKVFSVADNLSKFLQFEASMLAEKHVNLLLLLCIGLGLGDLSGLLDTLVRALLVVLL